MLKWFNRYSCDKRVEMSTTRKNIINIFLVLTILAVVTATKAEDDCRWIRPMVRPDECCQIQIITDEVKEKCKRHGAMNEENGPPHRRHNPCFFSCVGNETGILIDDEVQQTTLESILRNTFEDPDIVESVGSNFMKCSDKMRGKNPRRGPPSGPNCSPHGDMLMKCALMKTFLECPESVWTGTDECNAARDHFNKCNPHRRDDGKNEVEDEEI